MKSVNGPPRRGVPWVAVKFPVAAVGFAVGCLVGAVVGVSVGVSVDTGEDDELCESPPQAVRSRAKKTTHIGSRVLIFFIPTSLFNDCTMVASPRHVSYMLHSHHQIGYTSVFRSIPPHPPCSSRSTSALEFSRHLIEIAKQFAKEVHQITSVFHGSFTQGIVVRASIANHPYFTSPLRKI